MDFLRLRLRCRMEIVDEVLDSAFDGEPKDSYNRRNDISNIHLS